MIDRNVFLLKQIVFMFNFALCSTGVVYGTRNPELVYFKELGIGVF